jgi:hypothetical protein
MRAAATLAAGVLLVAVAAGCGGSIHRAAPGAAARATVTRYFQALAAGRADRACATLTPESRTKLAEWGHEIVRLRERSCAAALGALLRSPGGPGLRRIGAGARVTAVRAGGEQATVRVAGVAQPLSVVRDGGAWLLESEPTGERD